jgi:nucleotide-binding universal stress UspA family protein
MIEEADMDILTGRIVLGYDGSQQSGTAADWAAGEARRRGLSLVVLHAVDYLGLTPTPMGPAGWPAAFAADAAKIATAGADRARQHTTGIEVIPLTQITGAAGALVEASKDAALLVVGTHGRGALPGAVFGSVAFAVTGHAHCPVVVVRGDSSRRAGPDRPVVVGFDGSSGSGAAVRYAADVAADTHAPLTVITAYQPISPWILSGADYLSHPSEGRPDFAAIAHVAACETATEGLRIARQQHSTLPAARRAIRGPAGNILARAAEQAGLLVVGSRGHGGFAGLMLGSISHRVIRTSPCPVVVVHGGTPTSDRQVVSALVPLQA